MEEELGWDTLRHDDLLTLVIEGRVERGRPGRNEEWQLVPICKTYESHRKKTFQAGLAEGEGQGGLQLPPPHFFGNFKKLLRKKVFSTPPPPPPHFQSSYAGPVKGGPACWQNTHTCTFC